MPTIKHIGEGNNGSIYRVEMETEGASVRMDMRLIDIESLVEEGLEVLVARSTEEDPCPFCDPDKPGHCDLRKLLQSMLNELHR
jgi:hypothetical protein